ncbi:hypothetical protein ACO0LC_18165 [Undibacterium sp. JH2W]|uniref:hypothetical protein n=1 Tax=Undibacterium TaxID=401469 RepID=UPI003BF3E046
MRTIIFLACLSILAACNKPAEPKVEPKAESSAPNLLSAQKEQLDKAKAVADTVQRVADEQRAVIEVNTGGAAAKPAKNDANK